MRKPGHRLPVLVVAAAALAGGCATTSRDCGSAEATWRRTGAAAAPSQLAGGEPLAVYVASFGLAPAVAAAHPELVSAQVGLGISNRIADALYDSQRFRFLEEKVEVALRPRGRRVR